MSRASSLGWWLLVAAVMIAVGRLLLIFRTNLFPDESLYLWMSREVPLTFGPHPPGVPTLGRLGVAMFGANEFGVRVFTFLLATLTPGLVWLLARDMAGRWTAAWAALAVVATPMYAGFGSILTPDAPQLFFWCLALWLVRRAMVLDSLRHWLLAGLTLGIGLYFKVILILFVPALALALLLTPGGRQHLRRPGPWLAVVLAALVVGPFALMREHLEGWPTLRYHLQERQDYIRPTPKSVFIYHGGHLLFYSPVLYALALGALGWAGWQVFSRRRAAAASDDAAGHAQSVELSSAQGTGEGGRLPRSLRDDCALLFAFGALPWLFFASIALVTKRELSREQWDAVAYPAAYIAAALFLSTRIATSRGWRIVATAAPIAGLFICMFLVAEGSTGRPTAALGLRTPFSNLFGWRTMTDAANRELASIPPSPSGRPPFFLGHSFAEAFEFRFYDPASPKRAISAMDDTTGHTYGISRLLTTRGVNQGRIVEREGPGANAVYAEDIGFDAREDAKQRALDVGKRLKKLNRLFERVEPVPDVEILHGGRLIGRARLFRCFGLRAAPLVE